MSTDALNESVTGAVSLDSAASEHNSPEGEGVVSSNNLNSGPTDSSMSRKKSSVTSALKTAAGRSLSTAKVYQFNWQPLSCSLSPNFLVQNGKCYFLARAKGM